MSEAAGPTVGNVPQLGELLALLHRADAAFDNVEAAYRIWRHEERSSDASPAEIKEQKRRGATISSFSLRNDSDRPAETERVLRIWVPMWSGTATPGGCGTMVSARRAIKAT